MEETRAAPNTKKSWRNETKRTHREEERERRNLSMKENDYAIIWRLIIDYNIIIIIIVMVIALLPYVRFTYSTRVARVLFGRI